MRLHRRSIAGLAAGLMLLTLAGRPGLAQSEPQDYLFTPGRGTVVPVALSAEPDGSIVLAWPDTGTSGWDTALLHVGIAADDVPLPHVTIEAGRRRDRQDFRAAETGPRWINLSFLDANLPAGTRVTIRPSGIRIGTGETSLRLYRARPDLDGSVLVLAPHPDDAEIAAFGLYASTNATVVTVTAGNAGSPTYEAVFGEDEAAALYQFKGRVRVIDSITVPLQGGVAPDRAFNLGYFDARLADMYRDRPAVVPELYGPNSDIGVYRRLNVSPLLPHGPRESTWTNLVDDVAALVDAVDPAVVVAPHPQLDTHRDHQFTTVALAEALARSSRGVTLLLYTNHADGNRYPYGPAGTLVSLPPPVSRPVAFDRIYSFPVPPALQRDKLFALESMHDLRYSPTRQYQMAVGEGRAIEPEKEGPGPDITYLRRGPRSNELFFVYDEGSLPPMIERFLEGFASQAR